MEVSKKKKPKKPCVLLVVLALFVFAQNASAQTVADDLTGLGMKAELADYLAGIIPAGAALDNNVYLKGDNQAGSATINLIKLNTSDDTVINSSASDDLIIQLEDDANRVISMDAASDTALRIFFGDGGSTAAQELTISGGASDSDDDTVLYIAGGGAYSGTGTRGANCKLNGNEASGGGDFQCESGDASGSDFLFDLNNSASTFNIRTSAGATFLQVDQTAGTSGGINLSAQYGLHMAAYVPTMASTPVQGTNDFKIGVNVVPTAAALTGAFLPFSPTNGDIVEIINSNSANEVQIFPGSSDTINGAAGNTVIGLGAGLKATCYANSASAWFCHVPILAGVATPGA